jgi:trehalose 6-phosphate synthase/phosphatase
VSRIIVVSNRLPVTVRKSGGEIKLEASIGGLATGMKSAVAGSDSLWVGWPGYAGDSLSSGEREEIASHLAGMKASPVWMSRQDLKDFYHGFCNDVIWPLFHYFPTYVRYDHRLWQAYLRVNSLFADALLSIANEEDEFWIHDYQLMLLPLLIRRALPSSRIGFFLHIPFPSFELFRLLPWRREIIEGILGADLIGLHTYDYVRHFVSAGRRLLGLDHNLGQIRLPDRLPRVDAFPMGIDYDRYAGALKSREARRYADAILRRVTGCRVILSVDRLDYTKGILQRLRGYDAFLEANPGFREKVTMILIVAPSRTSVARYNRLKRAVSELVGTINGRYGTIGWQPVQFIYRAFAFAQLTAVYSISDVLLVTPLRDGMNLIVKEYVATRQDYRGVAVLSEAAGAASELGEALIVNPNNVGEIAAAIRAALEMPEDEQRDRNAVMHRRLRRYTVQQWAKDFLRALDATVEMERAAAMRSFTAEVRRALEAAYRAAARRLFLLNYGGTLVPFADRARRAAPDAELRSLLGKMGGDPANEVVVISGRDRAEMQGWFDGLPVSLTAGNGGSPAS